MFNIEWAEIFSGFSPEIAVLIIAMIPIAELRAAIPIGITVFDLPVITTFIYAFIGNLIPVVIILLCLEPVSRWLMIHSKTFQRFLNWLFDRTRKKHSEKFERYGALALISFVAIPLPITGGWTGSLAAFLFGIPFRKALPLIMVGVAFAGAIVTILSVGLDNIF
ncbi:small multi-drug export protein [Patescibacteria group bacterium]|nr:small multi-drug export protein [Patescibacteria group bacterium]MBU1890939.1 small multi-drug export protein [Patescibacteria group bacterium]